MAKTRALRQQRNRTREMVMPPSTLAVTCLSSSDDSSRSNPEIPHLIDDESSCRHRKRVRFSESDHGEIKVSQSAARTSIYFVSSLPSASLSKAQLWWSKEDREVSIHECFVAIKEFRADNTHFGHLNLFSNIYETCMEAPSHASSDYLMELANVSMPTQIRGLEWGIAPELRARRKAHIRDVLDVQNRIQNPRDREKFVSSKSLKSSRPSRIIARMIGEGDATGIRTEGDMKKTSTGR